MGKERIQIELFVVYGWFEAVFKEWGTNAYTCENVYIFSTNIGMEFRMKKCRILTLKRGKAVRCEIIKLPNSDVMKDIRI